MRDLRRALREVVSRLRRRLLGRPESTFMRVAYSTPRQVVLITTRHDGADNIWPMDFHVRLSFEPPPYAIAAQRNGYGAGLVRSSGVFGQVTHEVHRANAPRLHHLDIGLKEVAPSFEGAGHAARRDPEDGQPSPP